VATATATASTPKGTDGRKWYVKAMRGTAAHGSHWPKKPMSRTVSAAGDLRQRQASQVTAGRNDHVRTMFCAAKPFWTRSPTWFVQYHTGRRASGHCHQLDDHGCVAVRRVW